MTTPRLQTPLVLFSALLTGPAIADVVLLPAAKDNTLYEDPGGNLSNGSGESFFAGKTTTGDLRRGLISFDLTALPAGSTITSVTLTLQCTRSASLARPVSLCPLLLSWGEGASIALGEGGNGAPAEPGDATWTSRFHPGNAWATPGGDFSAAIATKQVSGNGPYTWSTPAMATDVQRWLDQPASNDGWSIVGDESVNQTAKRFASRENADPALRPTLLIEFTSVPSTSPALAAIGATCYAFRRSRRRA